MEGPALLIGGIVVVLLIQLYLLPMAQNAQTDPLIGQLLISVAAGALAVAVYNPISQQLQDNLALSSGNTAAYVAHGALFAGVAFGVMVLGDLLKDLF